MVLTESKFFDMAATMVSGALANPAHSQLIYDPYALQQFINGTLNALQQTMAQAGCQIVPDDEDKDHR